MDISAISCPSCNANVESANHVFFECDIEYLIRLWRQRSRVRSLPPTRPEDEDKESGHSVDGRYMKGTVMLVGN
ncbi:hypothetical protein Tco_0869607 [Tanacetum coccineum]